MGFPSETSPYLTPVILANCSTLRFSPSLPVSCAQNSSYATTAQPNPCASDPVVQAAVATLNAGELTPVH